MLYAKRTKDSYETFEADCPHCGRQCIFNRVSDLGGATKIDFRVVICLYPECGREFAINGDSADPAFAQVFFGVYELMPKKRYGEAVVETARAYEMFFEHSLREALVWKPFVSNGYKEETEEVNAASSALTDEIEHWPFMKMRNAFMNVAARQRVETLADGLSVIRQMRGLAASPPIDTVLSAVASTTLRLALWRLRDSKIARVRNAVVHKFGHRPEESDARALFEEARDLIWTLADELHVRYDSL